MIVIKLWYEEAIFEEVTFVFHRRWLVLWAYNADCLKTNSLELERPTQWRPFDYGVLGKTKELASIITANESFLRVSRTRAQWCTLNKLSHSQKNIPTDG